MTGYNIIPPADDEMLLSWINRLALENVIPIKDFYRNFVGGRQAFVDFVHMPNLIETVREFGVMPHDLVNHMTLYNYFGPISSWQQQEHILGYMCRDKSLLVSPLKQYTTYVRYCPECEREDLKRYGTRIYRRSHQLPNVSVCHRHGCLLMERKNHRDALLSPEGFTPSQPHLDNRIMHQYAVRTKEFLDAEFDCELSEIQGITSTLLKDAGVTDSKGLISMLESFYGNHVFEIYKGFNEGTISGLLFPRYVRKEYLFPTLFALTDFGEHITEEIKNRTEKRLDATVFPEAAGYKFLPGSRRNLAYISHDECGSTYIGTVHGFAHGWRCPKCDNASDDALFRRLFESVTKDHYEVLDEFTGWADPIHVIHKNCSLNKGPMKILPRSYYFEGTRCDCRKMIPPAEALQRVPEGYKLIHYGGTSKRSIFRCEDCGHEFDYVFWNFILDPYCRICEPAHATTEIYKKRVKNLVGDEYSVIGDYNGANQPVWIRHNKCGTILTMPANQFYRGRRCPKCSRISNNELKDLLRNSSDGRYDASREGRKWTITDTETKEEITSNRRIILQEIKRPTPSRILPKLVKAI